MTSASTFSEQAHPGTERGTENSSPRAGQQQIDRNSLPVQQPPLTDKCWLHREQPVPGQPYIIISQQAISQIDQHANSNMKTELGGALLGKAYRYENKVFVEISAALSAVSPDHGPIHFTFDANTWTKLQEDRAAQYPGLDIVGWFHTHPALGVFYSSDDVVVHSAAFTLPWHVGLVVDPEVAEAGFFGWVNGQLAPFSGCYELLDQQERPLMPWKVVRTAVWYDGVAEGDDMTPGVYVPHGPSPGLSGLTHRGMLLAGLLGLLLSMVLLVGGILPLAARSNQLQEVVLSMAGQSLATTNVLTCPDPQLRILSPVTGTAVTSGDTLRIIGSASYPTATRYRLEARPAGSENWALLSTVRRNTNLSQLGLWNTRDYLTGLYEIRLTAVDRNNIRLAQSPTCIITLEINP